MTTISELPARHPRFFDPATGTRRLVLGDTELGEHTVRAGQWVTGWTTAANRDPVRFAAPDRFDIRRPVKHLSFGTGLHHCLGAGLARLEQRVLLEEAVRRLPGLRRVPGAPLVRREWMLDNLAEAHFSVASR